ncbi:2-oxoglutarate carboxylase large subunit [bioreactor metagenome]|uniref:2-oxoglutarate carboxylase large subunit n=1 Tax=bioreactor metagenome TaxID=1076179 RepID=A0A645DGN8_9ZZZZ
MVGVQAAVNVLTGGRYQTIGKEIKAYIRGEYGRAPGPIDPELLRRVLGDEPALEGRPADSLEPEYPAAADYLGKRAGSQEDVLSYIAFPQQAEQFFARREGSGPRTFKYSIRPALTGQ